MEYADQVRFGTQSSIGQHIQRPKGIRFLNCSLDIIQKIESFIIEYCHKHNINKPIFLNQKKSNCLFLYEKNVWLKFWDNIQKGQSLIFVLISSQSEGRQIIDRVEHERSIWVQQTQRFDYSLVWIMEKAICTTDEQL